MPRIIAHRGARSLAPENTLAAYSRALTLPVDMVEGDVAITADGIPVMIHQETLEPDEKGSRLKLAKRNEARAWISGASYPEIANIDAGSWFDPAFATERIPKLSEVLSLNWRQKTLLLDLIDPLYWTNPDDSRVVSQFRISVVPLVRKAKEQGAQISVLAFNPTMLEMFQNELPEVPRTFALWTNQSGKEAWVAKRAAELKVTTLTIADFMLRDEPVWAKIARKQNLKLGVYELTPDSHDGFRSWTPEQRTKIWDLVIQQRVDWFTSDFPLEFAAYMDLTKPQPD